MAETIRIGDLVAPVLLLALGSTVSFVVTWFWYTKSARAKLNDRLEEQQIKQNAMLTARIVELEKQQVIQGQTILPISTAFQAILVKELTHLHTPEMDALLAKLGPPNVLGPSEESRLLELLQQRVKDLDGEIPESERDAAEILPLLMKRSKAEEMKLRDTTIVVIPSQPTKKE
jgi:hypothetical protein